MKRLAIALLILAVLAGGAYGAYKYAQNLVVSSIDEQIIPNIKQNYKLSSGKDLEVSHGSVEMTGRELTIMDIHLASPADGQQLKAKKLVATMLGWQWIFSDYSYKIEIEQINAEAPEGKAVTEFAGIVISQTRDGKSGKLEYPSIINTTIYSPEIENDSNSLTIDKILATGGDWAMESDGTVNWKVNDILFASPVAQCQLKYMQAWSRPPKPGTPKEHAWRQGEWKAELDGFIGQVLSGEEVGLQKIGFTLRVGQDLAQFEMSVRQAYEISKSERAVTIKEALGKDKLLFDLDFRLDYNRANQLGRMLDLSLKAADLGELKLSAEITGIDWDGLTRPEYSDREVAELLGDYALAGASLVYHDHSLVPKIFEYQSQQTKIPVKQLKAQLLVLFTLAGGFEVSDEFKRLHKAVSYFVGNPTSLCLKTRLEAPVTMASFAGMSFNQVLKVLNIDTECKPAGE